MELGLYGNKWRINGKLFGMKDAVGFAFNLPEIPGLGATSGVEANLQNCHDVELAESGLFKGSATIDEIEVRGRFEGNLVVRKRLFIRATGRVSGTIRYGQLEIERGGQISGDIQSGDESTADAPGARMAF